MDVSNASYYTNIQENNENEGSQMGRTKKNIQKKILYIDPISCRIDILPAAVPVIAGF
jgi:hypothetical protein